MLNKHPILLKCCTLEVGVLSFGVNVCICCGLDLRFLLVAHMLKAYVPAWGTCEELGYCQEVVP